MDWLPQTNYYRTHYEAVDKPHLDKSSLSAMSLGDKDQLFTLYRRLLTHKRRMHPFEGFSSTTGLGVVPRLLIENMLVANLVIVL